MKSENLQLIEPTVDLCDEYLAFCREFPAGQIDGLGSMGREIAGGASDFAAAVQRALDHARGINLPEGWVAAHTFWLVRDGRTILGTLSFRHALTEHLEYEGGHIGYAVRPSERRKGYATRMLAMALAFAKQFGLQCVLITCDKTNVASAGVILKKGGVLENEVPSRSPEGQLKQRYWIGL
jgi:predicted acetyltransferase